MAAKRKKTARRKAMPSKKNMEIGKSVGYWIFLVGIFIAIIAGLLTRIPNPDVLTVLAVLGLVVGLINVTLKDEVPFLVAALVILVASGFWGLVPFIGNTLVAMLQYIQAFVAPASIVVALKAIYHFGK